MRFITYDYFVGTYGGDGVSVSDFDKVVVAASARVNHLTYGRAERLINKEDPNEQEMQYQEKIRLATSMVVDELISDVVATPVRNGFVVKSESVGSHSVSYEVATKSERKKILDESVRCIVKGCLADTGLMYAGVDDVN